jgi:Fur family peroxide stress response transcriptional regulator
MSNLTLVRRLTPQRRKIWELLVNSRDHPTALEVYHRLREDHYEISFATVYNTLNYFRDLGLVQEIKVDGRAVRYDARKDPHGHLYCLLCGRLEDLFTPLRDLPALPQGWEILSEEIIYQGYCPECRLKKEGATTG